MKPASVRFPPTVAIDDLIDQLEDVSWQRSLNAV
jgi:hypothetical protein